MSASTPALVAPLPLPEELPASVEEFDEIISGEVAKYVKLSKGLGGLIEEQVCNGALPPVDGSVFK